MKTSLRLAVLAAGLVLVPYASYAAQTPPVATTQQLQPASSFIQNLGTRAIGIIADKSVTKEKRNDLFKQILSDSFDLKTIGRFVIGRNWNLATPEQQDEYMRLFQDLVVRTYGNRLSLYAGEGFVVNSEHAESEQDIVVNSQITHPDGSAPTKIDWRVRNRNGKFGVIDVVVEGVSLSVTQRQEYAAVLQNNGGQIEGLLVLMRQRLQESNG